ncbi:MAG: hypothetical protein GY940_35985 [bacterium]|nr:hypothetical protein [bacterium]
MEKTSIQLPGIKKGWYMSWLILTQAETLIDVDLEDTSKTYVLQGQKFTESITPPLSQGFEEVKGEHMHLIIKTEEGVSLTPHKEPVKVTTPNGQDVGVGYNITIADSLDDDYKDTCMSIMAWKPKGL